MFETLNYLEPSTSKTRLALKNKPKEVPVVELRDWAKVKDALRNFVYQNFNPGLLPQEHPLRHEIFENMASTSGLFLALEPQVFVSKIRCRVFRNWKAAEDYYSNTLREAKYALMTGKHDEAEIDDDLDVEDEIDVTATADQQSKPK